MIYDCNEDDITILSGSHCIVFEKTYINKYFNNCSKQHFGLDEKLMYINFINTIWISPNDDIIVIYSDKASRFTAGKIYQIGLKQSFTRIKLQGLRKTKNFNNSILRLCHTGKYEFN